MHKVKPVRMVRIRLDDLPDGAVFTHDGIRYIKLTYDRGCGRGVFVTTLYPASIVHINGNQSLEEQVVQSFVDNICVTTHGDIISYGIADTDDFQNYAHLMRPHIKDCWYVDMGVHDTLADGEYFYVDESCSLCTGNEYNEREDGVTRSVGVRAVYWFEPGSIVNIVANQ